MLAGDTAIVRLELNIDAMRLQVANALNSRAMELQAIIDAEVARMKDDLPRIIQQKVREAVTQAIHRAIDNEVYRVQQAIQPGIGKAVAEALAKLDQ